MIIYQDRLYRIVHGWAWLQNQPFVQLVLVHPLLTIIIILFEEKKNYSKKQHKIRLEKVLTTTKLTLMQ